MTVRKIIELIDLIKDKIGKDNFSSKLQDYLVTIQNNNNNLVLLKELTEKLIADFKKLEQEGIRELLDKVLMNKEKPFTDDSFLKQLTTLKEQNYPDSGSHYNTLNAIITQLQLRVNSNIEELDKISTTVIPFLSKDYSELQSDTNAIFAIIFNNEKSYNSLKLLSFELKNWDRGLFIYQQIISEETPKPFEIIEIDQGSIEVVLNFIFEVGEKLLDLFKTGFEVYGAYLAYKTVVQETLSKSFRGNQKLIKGEEEREQLLLENVRIAVREEVKKQAKKGKKQEALEKKIEEVTKLVTEHIIKGNSVKLLSAPEEKEEIFNKEDEKEILYVKTKVDYKKLDEVTKQLLISEFTTQPKTENYEID
ncbi:hypothetical protein [Lacihabitans soyangensis]|uniref:Uncharacterized protein n=1 Tax=Lacihabitans soyangensis TaxID=869394 RepID=A0AAE3KSW6_9BACT|nr:hypothetical protein [Lacihabitans soyangensis]MCP9761661.1 hypothetical protein [Lacihabitans soyangensis]